ncbi:hypothetical protein ACFW16_35830 [Inquilinus sp. NPDC058860]|uniref:hypothetical protein n=1 Tax=Inquilinus sp. NPDC058860 TaxID=3346652 RepID=UPI0036B6765B
MINIKAPAYVKEQIDDWARDDPSQTVRGLILRALKTYGLHIEDDDLKDRRRKDD